MSTSTLLFDLGIPHVKARLWSAGFAPQGTVPPPTAAESIGYPGVWDERFSGSEGTIGFQAVPAGETRVWFTKDGYTDQVFDTVMPDDGAKIIRLTPGSTQPGPIVSDPVSRLHCDWLDFVNEQGAPVYLRGATFFPAYEFFLRGESLEAPLLELQSLGCNALRVFGMSKYIQENELHRPAFKPQDWGDRYYDALPDFCRAMASYGQYIYWSIFPDNGFIMPDSNEQVRHFERMMAALSNEPNNLVELTNEPNAHGFNAVDVTKFTKPNGIPSNSGSYGDEYGGDLPPWPVWDFGDIHTSRSYPKQVLDSCTLNHPIAVKLHRPVGVGEPDRFGSGGNTDARKAAASAGAAMLSAFWFFHSRVGERCGVFDEETQPCALAAFQVLTAVR